MATATQQRLLWHYAARASVIPPVADHLPAGWAPRPGQVLRAGRESYCTDQGTHYPYPAVDAFSPIGTPIWAPRGGISYPEELPLGGFVTFLQDDAGMWWYFAHGNIPFKRGRVRQGESIGEVGNTGNARYTSSHVHFASAPDSHFNRGINGGSGTVWFQPWVWGQ